ncbi:hypothetical protein ABTZ78_30970 [Streptomyces bauhiniae]|uniref:hypothetical protein n=1 Tax=Streptomyces bauhiniae TaxID=2340725 RepID=UPI003327EF0A
MVTAGDPAVRGFHRVLARDDPATVPTLDLAARAPLPCLTSGRAHAERTATGFRRDGTADSADGLLRLLG